MRWMPILLIAAAACTEGSSCPSGSVSLGTFSLSYTQLDGGDTCFITSLPDGGAANQALFNTPSSTLLTFCEQDGGGAYSMQFYGVGNVPITLDGGAFTYNYSTNDVTGSACNCTLGIAETFAGNVTIVDGGATAFTGKVDENVTAQSGTCLCNTPCAVHYSVAGAQ